MPLRFSKTALIVGPRVLLLYSLIWLSAAVVARADLAPTRFVGSGITSSIPAISSVRMEKAEVEMVWGNPCSLSATFTMVNPTPTAEELHVGFPMPRLPRRFSGHPDPLSISFDDIAAVVTPPEPEDRKKIPLNDWTWYHCKHTFAPGVTTVVVKTILRPSLEKYGHYRETLFYCIQSGSGWADAIREERVVIRFPYPIDPAQVMWAQPAGYKIEGNEVCWRFTDFEPRGKELDIGFTYLRPDVMHFLQVLRLEQKKDPTSSSAALKLAKHLFALGDPWSNDGAIPSRLSGLEYEAILEKLSTADAAVFKAHYAKAPNGKYILFYPEPDKPRVDLTRLFAEGGYRDAKSRDHFVAEGEALLRKVLKRDRHNAEAWNIYLANYWRFNFAAYGHWFGSMELSSSQRRTIKEAAKNCPKDECIQRWSDILQYDRPDPELPAVREAMKRNGCLNLEYPAIEYGYY